MNSSRGVELWRAVCTPMAALVAPGGSRTPPPVGHSAFRRPRRRRPPALVARAHQVKGIAFDPQGLENVQKTLAGNRKSGVDAKGEKCVDKRITTVHARTSPRM